MTTREELIRQRNEIDAKLAKLDAAPWEERRPKYTEPSVMPISFDDNGFPCDRNDAYLTLDERDHVAHVYNAHPKLIACVRALRAIEGNLSRNLKVHPKSGNHEAATKALEELDAL